MTDTVINTEATATTTAAAKKPKSVNADMPVRSVFASPELASPFLIRMATELPDFGKYPFVGVGIDAEGNFDAEVYTDSMDVYVVVMKTRQGEKDNRGDPVQAIIVHPGPKLESVLESDTGTTWLEKIAQKEIGLVALRPIRGELNPVNKIAEMPTTLEAFISGNRESSGITEAYEKLWQKINATLSAISKPWARRAFKKAPLKQAMESAALAIELYPECEDRPARANGASGSLFVIACEIGIKGCAGLGLDPTIFQRWIDNRDKAQIEDTEEDAALFDDLDALAATMLAEPKADEAAPTTEGAAAEAIEGEGEQAATA